MIGLIGYTAAILTALTMMPQIIRSIRTKSVEDGDKPQDEHEECDGERHPGKWISPLEEPINEQIKSASSDEAHRDDTDERIQETRQPEGDCPPAVEQGDESEHEKEDAGNETRDTPATLP